MLYNAHAQHSEFQAAIGGRSGSICGSTARCQIDAGSTAAQRKHLRRHRATLAADGATAAAALLGWLCDRGTLRQSDEFWSYGYDTGAQAALLSSGAMRMHPDPVAVQREAAQQAPERHEARRLTRSNAAAAQAASNGYQRPCCSYVMRARARPLACAALVDSILNGIPSAAANDPG